jgi:predicted nucleic acid-binding Zn ribbon protein
VPIFFKGSGFYSTDYGTKGQGYRSKEKEEKPDEKKEEKPSEKGGAGEGTIAKSE